MRACQCFGLTSIKRRLLVAEALELLDVEHEVATRDKLHDKVEVLWGLERRNQRGEEGAP